MTARAISIITMAAAMAGCGGSGDSTAATRLPSAPLVRRLTGAITGAHTARARWLMATRNGPLLVLVLDSNAVTTCEDLGRQLREVLHARESRDRRTVAVTLDRDSSFIADWLRRERLTGIHVMATADDSLAVGSVAVSAPAVLLVDIHHVVSAGVLHASRVPNTRPVSFAAELGFH